MNKMEPLGHPLEDDLQKEMDKIFPLPIPSPNLFRIIAKNEALFKEMVETKFIGKTGLYDKKRLNPLLREKIIMRVCVSTKNDYEFALHAETISQQMGMTVEQIKDIKNTGLNKNLWTEEDIILFDLIDNLIQHNPISEDLFGNVSKHFDEKQILDIVFLIGLYNGVAMMVSFTKPEFDNYRQYLKK